MTAIETTRPPGTAATSTGVFAETPPCRTEDPDIWFSDTPEGVEFAKALCGTCPAREACFAMALEQREPWGVWGGELFDAGRVIPRKRPRGRPRKHPVST